MRKNTWSKLLCLVLACVLSVMLYGCPGGETPPVGSSTTTGGGGTVLPPDPEGTVYGNGEALEGAGATLSPDSFAMTGVTPDEANAQELTASGIVNLFRGAGPEAGATYRVSDGQPIVFDGASGRTYDGKGAVILAPQGVIIRNGHTVELTNMTVVGPVTVEGSVEVTMHSFGVMAENATALTVDAESSAVTLSDLRLTGKTGLANASDNLTVTASYIAATETGIADTSRTGSYIAGCYLTGSGTGITTTASESAIRENTLVLTKESVGIAASDGLNAIIALNRIEEAQTSVSVQDAVNTVVILNSAVSVEAQNSISLYICDNNLGGRVSVQNNNYLLADGNRYPEDGKTHAAVQSGNENTNGDTLMDVDARLEVGADPALLPHVNKDLFVGMERKTTVKDLTPGREPTGIANYIKTLSATDDIVIVPPGAYAVNETVRIGDNTTVYAYGVYMERQTSLGQHLAFWQNHNITIKGLTLAYKQQSCGQVYVLAKPAANTLLVVTGAGMMNEFGNTDTAFYNTTGMGAQRAGTFYAYCDTGFNYIRKRSDGLMEMSVSPSVYEMIAVGDILTCRTMNGARTVVTEYSSDITFQDMVVFGGSAGFAFVEGYNETATTYYRLANTTRNGEVITEEEYNRYLALEEEYGVDLEISIDSEGRYRGSLPHIGSIDATHTICCAQGSVAISCLFENMCDDGTNQRHTHSRLAGITDNGDGTTTLTYKGNWSTYSYEVDSTGHGYCTPFVIGERVYVYTSAGQLVCDTEALTPSVQGPSGINQITNATYNTFTVDVATEDVNFAALAGYDLSDDNCVDTHKVLVDNMSKASNGFIFDNTVVRNIRSRGLLIKASEGKIINCTFENVGMSCVAVLYEIYWGESGVSENLEIARNYINHSGYFQDQDIYSPIAIQGLGSRVDEDYLLYKNINITDNVIRNRTTQYAVYVNSARDVNILRNDFGTYADESEDHISDAIHINGAMNILIEDNIFSPYTEDICIAVYAEHNKNVHGKDVGQDGPPFIEDRK